MDSMRGLGATVDLPERGFNDAAESRLARHIGQFKGQASWSRQQLELAGTQFSGLHTVRHTIDEEYEQDGEQNPLAAQPLNFPPSLTRLELKAVEHAWLKDVNTSTMDPGVRFAPLRNLALLHDLCLDVVDAWQLSPTQVEELRALHDLSCLNMVLGPEDLRALLATPHSLQWQALSTSGRLDPQLVSLLASLPALTSLEVHDEEDLAFLRDLPNLRTLRLARFAMDEPVLPPQDMLQELQDQACSACCAHITHLAIDCSMLTSSHVQAILAHMPALRTLELESMPELESLGFLSSDPVRHTLTSLSLSGCMHSGLRALDLELRRVLPLQALASLSVRCTTP